MLNIVLRVLAAMIFASQIQAETVLQDTQGAYFSANVPQRIATLNWDIAEQLIELETTPIAMPDVAGYRTWVVNPRAEQSIQDIGRREEPNLLRLAQLKPDLIIIATSQQHLLASLEKIAPVMLLDTYSATHHNAQAAIDNFMTIAKLLNKTDLAEHKLAAMNTRFSVLSEQLKKAYGEPLPKISAFRFASLTSVYLYGGNSTVEYVLQRLGFEAAMPKPDTQWGVTQIRLNDLQHVGEGIALYFEPFDQQKKLAQSIIWQAMPFVRNGRINSVSAVWNYGGAMSLGYSAEALATSLLAIAPNKGACEDD